MWAAKFASETARLYDAADACAQLMITLGIAIDGGMHTYALTHNTYMHSHTLV